MAEILTKVPPSEFIKLPEYKVKFGDAISVKNPDQTMITKTLNQGEFTSSHPAPTNILDADKELMHNINKNVSPTRIAAFIAGQTALYALNPHTSYINVAVVSGVIPGEGVIPTTLGDETLRPSPQTSYAKTYGNSISASKISGVAIKTIEGSNYESIFGNTSLATDQMKDVTERAFETNAIKDKTERSFNSKGDLQFNPDLEADATSNLKPETKIDGMSFPFFFESLNYGEQDYSEKFISFQATFKGIKETYAPKWSEKSYFGRSTSIYTYANTARTLNFMFTIFANNKESLWLVKQRINWLAKHCYPTYVDLANTNSKIIYEAPVIKITIGDLFRDTPGIITNLEFDWDMEENALWELSKNMIMPHGVNVTMAFTILHDKFMRNSPQSLSQDIQSSDFYSFILPEKHKVKFKEDFTSEDAEVIAAKELK